jgi:hypothetical protein
MTVDELYRLYNIVKIWFNELNFVLFCLISVLNGIVDSVVRIITQCSKFR